MGWNQYTEKYFEKITTNLRKKRVEVFVKMLGLTKDDQILDLGSEDGSYLSSYYPWPQNITLADINEEPMKKGAKLYGLKGYVVLPQDGILPFKDKQYDAVWCNSVIEHVTLDKNDLCHVTNDEFVEQANNRQRIFASEIERVSKKYFVQTPNIHFPIEAHSWLPFVQYLTQKTRCKLSKLINKVWIKQWSPDFLLYNDKRLQSHFPESTMIMYEKSFYLKKSLFIIKT